MENEAKMKELGEKIGRSLSGGTTIELVGDVGAGKTTLTKGIAVGMGVDEVIQSPTFTISRSYQAGRNLQLVHYDFYRLKDAGIMADELAEAVAEPNAVVVVEWGDVVAGVLPNDRLSVFIRSVSEAEREIELKAYGDRAQLLAEELKNDSAA